MPWIKTSWKLEEHQKEIWFMFALPLFLLRHVDPAESQHRDWDSWSSYYSYFYDTKRKINTQHDSRIKYIWFFCTALCHDFGVLRRMTCDCPCSAEWAQEASLRLSAQESFSAWSTEGFGSRKTFCNLLNKGKTPLPHFQEQIWIMLSLRTNGINWVNLEFLNW